MHIEINIYPDSFPISVHGWKKEINKLWYRIHDVIMESTVTSEAYAIGKTTLLANDDSGIIVATIELNKS